MIQNGIIVQRSTSVRTTESVELGETTTVDTEYIATYGTSISEDNVLPTNASLHYDNERNRCNVESEFHVASELHRYGNDVTIPIPPGVESEIDCYSQERTVDPSEAATRTSRIFIA